MADSPADIRAEMAQTRASLASKLGELQRRILGGAGLRTIPGETPMAVKKKAKKSGKAAKRGKAKAKPAAAAKRKTAAKAKSRGKAKAAPKARRGAAKTTAKRKTAVKAKAKKPVAKVKRVVKKAPPKKRAVKPMIEKVEKIAIGALAGALHGAAAVVAPEIPATSVSAPEPVHATSPTPSFAWSESSGGESHTGGSSNGAS
jgi:hypothetical protein